MPQEVSIDINPIDNPTHDRRAEFNPPTQTAMVGDLIFWRNNDEQEVHQPKPVNGANNAWVKAPISVKLDDQPGTSNVHGEASGTTAKGKAYECVQHPNETGTLIVRNNIDINNAPGVTLDKPQAVFKPTPQTVQVDEVFIWSNNDIRAHWPAPSQAQKTAWLKEAIKPGQTSETVSLSNATGKNGLTYVCTLHPNEIGILIVVQPE